MTVLWIIEQNQVTCVYKQYLAALSGCFLTRKHAHSTNRTLCIISQNYLAIKYLQKYFYIVFFLF